MLRAGGRYFNHVYDACCIVLRTIQFHKQKRKKMLPKCKRYIFYFIKLPLILLLIILGFMMEVIVELPFIVLTRLDGRRRCRRN